MPLGKRSTCLLHLALRTNSNALLCVFFVLCASAKDPFFKYVHYFGSDLISEYSLFFFFIIITNILLPLLNALPPNH